MRQPLELAYSLFLPRGIKKWHEKCTPILIFHCVLGSRKSWESTAQIIADETGKHVYTVDACNHGESPRTDQSSNFDMATDVHHFLKHQGITRCDMIGHSMGGRTAMMVALQKPAIVRTVSVVDVSPIQEPAQMDGFMAAWICAMRRAIRDLPEQITVEAAKKEIEEKLFQEIMDQSFSHMLLDTLIFKNGSFHWMSNLDFLETHFGSQLQHFPDMEPSVYPGPTCFIGSGKPIFLKLRDHLGIYKLFPRAEISYIPGAGHHVFLDKPVEFLKAVIDFHRRFNYIP